MHGLNGSKSTWVGEKDRFIENLIKDNQINKEYDFFTFEYYTKIFEPFSGFKKLIAMIPGTFKSKKKKAFNIGIRRTAQALSTQIALKLNHYEKIIIISHSMGGLVAKKAFTYGDSNNLYKIAMYVSLSVPHSGSSLAKLGKKLLRNPQLIDLSSFSEFTSILTQEYSDLDPKPYSLYQTGSYDHVVPEGSAIPAGISKRNRIDSMNTHFDVLSIDSDIDSSSFLRIKKELKRILVQWSPIYLANIPLSFEYPPKATFQAIATAIVKDAQCAIEFDESFDENELKTPLRSTTLSAINTYEALLALRSFGFTDIPEYKIEIKNSTFKIIKK